MDFVDKLTSILEDHFGDDPDYQWEFETSPAGQVSGVLTLKAFEDKREYERQDMIWDVLDGELDDDERFRITIIVANSPEESAIQRAEERAEQRIKRARKQHNP